MSELINSLISYLEALSKSVPLPVFSVVGSFIEEVFAPIPSPLVMTLVGTIAETQRLGFLNLLFVASLGSLAKTAASYIIYFIFDKAEDTVIAKFGKFFGVSKNDTEGFGKYLNRGHWDYALIFLLRAIPVMPTSPVSAISGLVKLNLKTFFIASFLGLVIRSLFYIYLGYYGLHTVATGLDSAESIGKILLLGAVVLGLGFWLNKRRKDEEFVQKFLGKFDRLLKKKN